MNARVIIKCPDTSISKRERARIIFNNEFKAWITNTTLVELIKVFDNQYSLKKDDSLTDIIRKTKSFAESNWDYRKKQTEATTKEGEAARWLLHSEEIIDKNSNLVFECAKTLGLIGHEDTWLDSADYILPLGGARMSNLRRCELARKTVDNNNLNHAHIVALSGMRPLSDSEINNCIDTCAIGATYEFQAISKGLESAFELSDDSSEKKHEDSNPNASFVIRKYEQKYNGNDIYSVAAPSTQPETRRANSADCFKFFFENFDVPKGSKIINCTSQIYCSYQQVKALSYALKHDVIFDTIGFPFALNTPNVLYETSNTTLLSKPVNYLQEIKATIDAMYDFINEFSHELV